MSRGTLVTCDGIHGSEIPFIDGVPAAKKYGWTSFNSDYDPTCRSGTRKDLCPMCSTIFFMAGMSVLFGFESDSRFRFYMWDAVPPGVRDWEELYPYMYLGHRPVHIRCGVVVPTQSGG